MPPKAQAKKGKDEQEDYTDLPTLPSLNTFIFSLVYKNFFTTEAREKLQKFIHEKLLVQERIKTLTRDEILTYGKSKQIILEPSVIPSIPQDDPRLKMSEAEQIARAAAERLFELQVQARRQKKEKILKLEEEAKTQGITDVQSHVNSNIDSDQLEMNFQLVEFPNSRAEAMAFAKYSYSLNCVIEINQANKPIFDEEGEEQTIEAAETTTTEIENREKVQAKINMLREAKDSSVKGSPLRNLAFVESSFINEPEITYKYNDAGEEVEERKEPEMVFIYQLMESKIEQYGALYIKYLKFKERVRFQILAPDLEAMKRLQEIEEAEEEADILMQQQKSFLSKDVSQLDTNQLKEFETEKQEINQSMEEQQQQNQIRNQEKEDLKKRLLVSIDDERDPKRFKMDVYKNDFIKHAETQNQIGSILSAMVTQISLENNKLKSLKTMNIEDESTEESIDDLFENHQKEVQMLKGETIRGSIEQQEQESLQPNNPFLALPQQQNPYVSKQKQTESLGRAKTVVGEIEYTESLDGARQCMYKLPKEVTIDEEDKSSDIYLREKKIFQNLVIPGAQRYLMPPVPQKSQRIRDMERPQMYPFCTLPIEDVERGLIMKNFQDLIKSNDIENGFEDEGNGRFKAFERHFESHMKPDIMRQVIAETQIQEPDMASMYYPRQDALLVAFFNRKNEEDEDGPDGIKEWRAAYRVMPDFENWIQYFSDELLILQAQPSVKDDKTSQPPPNQPPPQLTKDQQAQLLAQQQLAAQQIQVSIPKYQLDSEMLPDQLLDVDDQKVQNIQEQIQMFFPEDNSIMKVSSYQVGGKQYSKSSVTKESVTFGLRKATPTVKEDENTEEKEYGLFSYKKMGSTELWMTFPDNTKMLVEPIGLKRNERKMIRIDPPKPTPEEIQAREEAIKQAQAAAAKNKGKGQQQPVVIEEYKEPEPTWEPEAFNDLDNVYLDEEIELDIGPMVTTSYNNGLIVQHLHNGSILMIKDFGFESQNPKEEKNRVITMNGTVIRELLNSDREVLFPNGNRAYFQRSNFTWTLTNNKGYRRCRKDGVTWEIDRLNCAVETDAVSLSRSTFREDNSLKIESRDGSIYCQFDDGTMMNTSPDNQTTRIEKEGFSPIVVSRSQNEATLESYAQSRNLLYPKDRALDGVVVKVYLPDGTISETFKDAKFEAPDQKGILIVRHLFSRPDFSAIIIDNDGDAKIISSNARSVLNEVGRRVRIGNDTDYLEEMNNLKYQYTPCIYYAHLDVSDNPAQSQIWARNIKGDQLYKINGQNYLYRDEMEEKSYCSLKQKIYTYKNQDDSQLIVGSNYDDGRIIEEVGGYKNPFTKHFLYPRLFFIKKDGSGYELHTKEQLEYYFRIQKNVKIFCCHNLFLQRPESIKQKQIVIVGNSAAKSHYFVTKVQSYDERERQEQQLSSLLFPQNAIYAIERLQKRKAKDIHKKTHSLPQQYLFRQIFEFADFPPFKQESFYDDIYRFKQWKLSQVRYDTEFGITFTGTKENPNPNYVQIEDDEKVARRIILKIMRERKKVTLMFEPDSFKRTFLNEINKNDEMSEYLRRTSVHLEKYYERRGSQRQQVSAGGQHTGNIPVINDLSIPMSAGNVNRERMVAPTIMSIEGSAQDNKLQQLKQKMLE